MARKVFVSYKYSDGRHCKDRIMAKLGSQGQIYKGERGFNDLSSYSASTIKNYLSDLIYDSSVLLLIISPNVAQSDWVDWEIGYALRNSTRNGRTSKRNGILCVVQKDQYTGNSLWAYNPTGNVYSFYLPARIKNNMQSTYGPMNSWDSPYPDYCMIVSESTFMANPQKYIEEVFARSILVSSYPITLK